VNAEKELGYLSSIGSISYDKLEIDPIDDYLFNIVETKIETPTTAKYLDTAIEYPDLMLIKSEGLNESEFEELQESNAYKELYVYSNYLPYKMIYNGFVFKINFNGYEKYVYIYGSQNNYKLKNLLYDILVDVKTYVPSAIFDFEQYSYVVTSADKYPYSIEVVENDVRETIDNYPHPFIR
jgi:hypothetical protein